MSNLSSKPTESAIAVFVVSGYELVREALKVLVASNRDISVTGVSSFEQVPSHLKEVSDSDVAILYCSTGDRIGVVSDLLESSPRLRVIAVVERNDLDSQAEAIRLGAVGIVHKEQNPKILIEAIRMTHQGETWLSQVILNKILVNERNGRSRSASATIPRDRDALTPRELEVTKMIGDGLKNKEIAKRLLITEATVRHHLSSIYGKLGVEDRLNLVILAHNNGLIELSHKE